MSPPSWDVRIRVESTDSPSVELPVMTTDGTSDSSLPACVVSCVMDLPPPPPPSSSCCMHVSAGEQALIGPEPILTELLQLRQVASPIIRHAGTWDVCMHTDSYLSLFALSLSLSHAHFVSSLHVTLCPDQNAVLRPLLCVFLAAATLCSLMLLWISLHVISLMPCDYDQIAFCVYRHTMHSLHPTSMDPLWPPLSSSPAAAAAAMQRQTQVLLL